MRWLYRLQQRLAVTRQVLDLCSENDEANLRQLLNQADSGARPAPMPGNDDD